MRNAHQAMRVDDRSSAKPGAQGRRDNVLRLPDGRRLAYAEYGERQGLPVMCFHGNPGSRLFWGLLPGFPFQPNLHLIAPDRPGFGRSDFDAGRTLAGWPDDVAALADALGLGRFAVLGLSGGGPFALACAWKIPERLSATGVVSSVGPYDAPGATVGMSRTNRGLFLTARRAPWLVRRGARAVAPVMQRAAERLMTRLAYKFPEEDRKVLSRPEVRALVREDFPEAFRQCGRGPAHELILYARPWPFRPERIETEVQLWQGEFDWSVGAMGRYLAKALPNCRATLIPNAGHFWIVDHLNEVLLGLTSLRT